MREGVFIMKNFRQKTIQEIKIWAWIAVVLPITALAGLFFLWAFGWYDYYSEAMVIGATTMFGFAVIWWWWTIHKIAQMTELLSNTINKFDDVKSDLKHLRQDIKNLEE